MCTAQERPRVEGVTLVGGAVGKPFRGGAGWDVLWSWGGPCKESGIQLLLLFLSFQEYWVIALLKHTFLP